MVVLVDSSVWIDHLHRADERLMGLLERDEVATHPWVVEELALGSIKDRDAFLDALASLRTVRSVSHAEVLALVEERRLWGRGLSAVDVHLLGSVLVEPGARLWTRDRRLAEAAAAVGVAASAD